MVGGGQHDRAHEPKFGGLQSITFYCGPAAEPWDPDSLWTGIGGSEEALILLSRQFAELGWDTRVFAAPRAARNFAGVRWFPYQAFASQNSGQVFVAWRNPEFVRLASGFETVCHWVHDRLDFGYPLEIAQQVDGIFLVSRHQAQSARLSAVDPRKLYPGSNGLDEEFLRPPGNNEATRVIYASCPARGLVTLLEMWPAVRARIPEARLDVFHGFTTAYADATRLWPGLEHIKEQVLRLLDRLAPQGVTFHGMVGQDQLAEGFARAGVWAYPTHCCETSCITAMKALAMGCLPVTTGHCALRETLGPWERGPATASGDIHRSWWRRRQYLHCLLRAMKAGTGPGTRADRLAAAAWARQRYSWRSVAADWSRVLHEIAVRKLALGSQNPAIESH
jgi:glycosyltransferase involved in cell wall biosynthesis